MAHLILKNVLNFKRENTSKTALRGFRPLEF